MPEEAIQRWMIKGATPAENFTSDSVKTYLNRQGTAEKGLDCAICLCNPRLHLRRSADPLSGCALRCRFIPIHEWEFSHRPADTPGAATQCFAELQSVYAEPYAAGRAQFLTWGESIELD